MAATLSLLPPQSLSLSSHLHFPLHSTPISNSCFATSLSFNSNSSRNPRTNGDEKPQFSRSDAAVKMPTAPWMKAPLLLQPSQVLDLSRPRKEKKSAIDEDEKRYQSLTGKVSGGRGKKAMKKIFERIEKLREARDSEEAVKNPEAPDFGFSLEELGDGENSEVGGKMPWEGDEKVVFRRTKKEKVATAAELSLDRELLERLRSEAARMRSWVKVNKAGVTQAVVDQVHLIWKDNELAMLKFGLPLCRNMDRAREILETKTGGLVVWSKRDELVIYRGCGYQFGQKTFLKMNSSFAGGQETSSLKISNHEFKYDNFLSQVKSDDNTIDEKMSIKDGEIEIMPINGSLYEREADRLLDGLGPRFIDWWMPKPLPVDADFLPEVVPGFRPPFRRCPPHASAKLTDDELTYLRKLARALPTHFVLGRNKNLQGLAAAIIKLWEKCHIVKIAVKWGTPNTDDAQMAYELRYLTGGVLLLRNKFLIILYRGKDFLPCKVQNLVAEREMELKKCQLQEEAARLKASGTFYAINECVVETSTSGTLTEFKDIQVESERVKNGSREIDKQLEAEKERLEKLLRNQERKLRTLNMKIKRSAKELAKLNSAWRPAEQDADQEMITQEERECFRKIGQKMDSSLVLGRRGVFDGVIEGLHQHWKHREIAKVITMQRLFSQVARTAKQLEAESGGILVSIDKLKEGHAIILYRGKNYRRPLNLVSQNLLNKREALHWSLEMQRIGAELEKRRGTI
ncbi:chloroplastic group IIA intron splicing facilitator CRS1, chloroplastic isoform X2 [Diospyros lotus]|uniref:chloroplastic group IIA intron splicing facilitator CRS1, chloroplastic isoform X2 n=1 Tax=Diospyros lotus TaxID=55363 RepID=UPI0022555EC0|nr:chloroplastic group IIA intron splicing facilitator CRS1, chloroplastic isoform X2 [Diospyros lotus]